MKKQQQHVNQYPETTLGITKFWMYIKLFSKTFSIASRWRNHQKTKYQKKNPKWLFLSFRRKRKLPKKFHQWLTKKRQRRYKKENWKLLTFSITINYNFFQAGLLILVLAWFVIKALISKKHLYQFLLCMHLSSLN